MQNLTKPAKQEYLTPAEASEALHVHPRTLGRMADRGDIGSIRLPSGHRRYRREDIAALASGEQPASKHEVAS